MKLRLFPIFLVFFTTITFGQSLSQKVSAAFAELESEPALKYGVASLTVLNAETGELIFSKNAQTGLAPASTLKTVTSATAFSLLGGNFKWETTLGYSGTLNGGTLKGDLILKGSGDPTLGSDRYNDTKAELILNKWSSSIKQAGIKKIEGTLVIDDSLFGTQIVPQGWIWQDIGNYYGAGASSANWRENEFGVIFKAGTKPGDPAKVIEFNPSVKNLKIVNEVVTGKAGSGDNVYAYSAPYSDIVYLRGTYGLDLNKTIKISVPDPAVLLGTEFKKILDREGISVNGFKTWRQLNIENKGIPVLQKVLNVHQSPALTEVVYWLNQKSLNLYAENILKTLAVKQGKAGSFDEGVDVIKNYWKSKIGVDINSLSILDGSGLSPENRVSTETMARILQSVKKETWFKDYLESFPLYNNMKMKSGSIRNALCFAGYQTSSGGTSVVFSIITNNYNGSTSSIKQKIFKTLDVLK